jgi:hypothetical protein
MPFWVDNESLCSHQVRQHFTNLIDSLIDFHHGFCITETLGYFKAISQTLRAILKDCMDIERLFKDEKLFVLMGNLNSNIESIKELAHHANAFTLYGDLAQKYGDFTNAIHAALKQINRERLTMDLQATRLTERAEDSEIQPSGPIASVPLSGMLPTSHALLCSIDKLQYMPLTNVDKCRDKFFHFFSRHPVQVGLSSFSVSLALGSLLSTGLELLQQSVTTTEQCDDVIDLNSPRVWMPLVFFNIGVGAMLYRACKDSRDETTKTTPLFFSRNRGESDQRAANRYPVHEEYKQLSSVLD